MDWKGFFKPDAPKALLLVLFSLAAPLVVEITVKSCQQPPQESGAVCAVNSRFETSNPLADILENTMAGKLPSAHTSGFVLFSTRQIPPANVQFEETRLQIPPVEPVLLYGSLYGLSCLILSQVRPSRPVKT